MAIWVYILKCADGSYYTGSHRGEDMRGRMWEHDNAVYPKSYTAKRLPVQLVWAECYEEATQAIAFEQQIKGWSRKKKEALIRGDWEDLPGLSRRGPA